MFPKVMALSLTIPYQPAEALTLGLLVLPLKVKIPSELHIEQISAS